MRYIILFAICMQLFALHTNAQKKVNRQYFINLLDAGEYDKVFDTAIKLRKQVYGKNAVIDYFIAKSLCLDGYKEKASYCFNRIIKNHKLTVNTKNFIIQEISTCNAPPDGAAETPVVTNTNFSYINNLKLPEASVGGKMGRVYDCFSGAQTIDLNNMVSQDELELRLFSIDQKKEAVHKIRSILNDQYKVDTSGRYVFVTLKSFPLDSASSAAKRLEEAYGFFVRYYGLRAPDKLITVYILPNQQALKQTADLVHGIQLPDPSIGYSNLSDLSLLGLGESKQLGTLYHELFHLMIRTDLGDIPAFLDEGLASLYSVSKWSNGKLIGDHRPWRLDELKEAKSAKDVLLKIPPLQQLINYSWEEFDGQETKNVCQVAVNYSLSNFVMIYLQEKNLLQQMVTAFKNRPFVPSGVGEQKSNLQIFEQVVKDSINNFTLKFDSWFRNQYNFNLYKEDHPTPNSGVSMQQSFINARLLLYETNEKVFKYKEEETFKKLKQELDSMESDYRQLDASRSNINNAPVIMNQQSLPVNSKETKNNEIQMGLNGFEKKLRKLIFDKSPKMAN